MNMRAESPVHKLFAALSILLALVIAHSAESQTSPCTATNTPATTEPKKTWPQNTPVTVNFSTDFTATEFNCLRQVFENINVQNASAQGNASGVLYSVTQSSTPVAQVTFPQPNVAVATNSPGVSFGLQINNQSPGSLMAGVTYNGNNGTNRNSAVVNLSPSLTNCTAEQMTLAHEIGHTMGLDECTSCAQGASAMNRIPCATFNALNQCTALDWNNTTYGRTNLSPCDNDKVQDAGNYDPNTVNQPTPPPPPPEESCPNPGECQNWNTVDCRCEDELLNFEDKGVSPIILALDSSAYRLVGPSQGVDFDLDADGLLDRIGWTRANDMVGFLALDRNRNGLIDNGRELFGNYTPLEGDSTAAHGFDALSYWDAPSAGGNADGWIADTDLVWRHLLIWVDLNHDGISQPGELHPLSTFNITRISTSAFPERRRDAFANEFRLRGQFIIDGHPRWAYDVYFAVVR